MHTHSGSARDILSPQYFPDQALTVVIAASLKELAARLWG